MIKMKEIRFTDIGEGIVEGHILKWNVKDFDEVKEDQELVQIETDKAVVNIPAPSNGFIKIIAIENKDIHVNDVLAYIGEKEELLKINQDNANADANNQNLLPNKKIMEESQPLKEMKLKKQIIATPYIRKLSRDLNIDINKVNGTGPNNRIMESDVRNFADKNSQGIREMKKNIPEIKTEEVNKTNEKETELIERIPLSQTRKAIARNMEESWKIPRAVHMDLIDATTLYEKISKEKDRFLKEFNIKLTFLPFIIKATIEALKENPRFNASYDKENQELIIKKYYNIGLAAEANDGLKVIVIKDCDKKTIKEIASEIQELHKKIIENTITFDEMKDNSFTITNVGSLGGGFFSVAMINPPDTAILAIHLIKDMPIVKDNQIVIRKILPFSITFDHRAVDGADTVKFGNAIKAYIEDPDFLELL